MDDGLLLESIEGLDNSPFSANGAVWNCLQDLKEEISQELLGEGSICQADANGAVEDEVSEATALEINFAHRHQLEAELRAINRAQDRLLDGSYGKCEQCGMQITQARLTVNPYVPFCLDCQKVADGDRRFRSL
jgi:RNA polymerase-binding transcription factor DksA